MNTTFEYDVALSFAGEDRDYVSKVASTLKARGIAVFYDEFEKVKLWGKDLYEYLDDIYRHKARYCVIFISTAYANKLWTNHERQSAQARAFESSQEYILPARLDKTEIPGIRPTMGYIDLSGLTAEDFSKLIIEKLGSAQRTSSAPVHMEKDKTRVQFLFNSSPPISATLKEIDDASTKSLITFEDPNDHGRILYVPSSLKHGFYERTKDSLLFQKKIITNVKDGSREESFGISTDGSFQWIDNYSLKSDKSSFFSAAYLSDQIICALLFGRRWLSNLASILNCEWNELTVGVQATIPPDAVLYDNQKITDAYTEIPVFTEASGEVHGIIKLLPKELVDANLLGKYASRLVNYVINSFEYKEFDRKAFASVTERTMTSITKWFESGIQ